MRQTARHRRQRPRPDGAALMRYVLCFCVKPLLEAGRDGGGGVRTGASASFVLRWRFVGGGSHRSGGKITEEPYIRGSRCGARGASVCVKRPCSRGRVLAQMRCATRRRSRARRRQAYGKEGAERVLSAWAAAVRVAGALAARFE